MATRCSRKVASPPISFLFFASSLLSNPRLAASAPSLSSSPPLPPPLLFLFSMILLSPLARLVTIHNILPRFCERPDPPELTLCNSIVGDSPSPRRSRVLFTYNDMYVIYRSSRNHSRGHLPRARPCDGHQSDLQLFLERYTRRLAISTPLLPPPPLFSK